MKRVLAFLLVIIMIFGLAACGGNKGPVYDGPELLRYPQIDLGENLPSFVLGGEYYKEEITEEQAASGLVDSYTALSTKVESLNIYRVPNNHASIMDRMTYEEGLYGYQDQQLIFAEFDTLIEPNDYHYGYYMAYVDGAEGENPYYLRNYIFLDGDDFVKAEFKVPAFQYTLEEKDINIGIWLPYAMTDAEITDEELEAGIVLDRFADDEYYSTFTAKTWAASGAALETALLQLRQQYDVRVEYSYDYPISDTESQKCVYLKYYETIDNVVYMHESVLTIANDTFVEFAFKAPADEATGLQQQMSTVPMMWSMDKVEK